MDEVLATSSVKDPSDLDCVELFVPFSVIVQPARGSPLSLISLAVKGTRKRDVDVPVFAGTEANSI